MSNWALISGRHRYTIKDCQAQVVPPSQCASSSILHYRHNWKIKPNCKLAISWASYSPLPWFWSRALPLHLEGCFTPSLEDSHPILLVLPATEWSCRVWICVFTTLAHAEDHAEPTTCPSLSLEEHRKKAIWKFSNSCCKTQIVSVPCIPLAACFFLTFHPSNTKKSEDKTYRNIFRYIGLYQSIPVSLNSCQKIFGRCYPFLSFAEL